MDFIGRSTWGARHAAGSGARAVPTAEAWLHHSVTRHLPTTATVAQECEQMRLVEGIGQSRFGKGFSYNLALFPSGRAYVGCGVRRIGTHTGGRNTKALGVVLVGDFHANPVSPQLADALVMLLQYGHRQGWIDQPRFDGGHRDLKATACPGRHAYALLPTINQRASGQPGPSPSPSPVPQEKAGPRMAGLIKNPDRPEVFGTDGVHKWHVPSRPVLDDLIRAGVYGDGTITPVAQATIDALPLAQS